MPAGALGDGTGSLLTAKKRRGPGRRFTKGMSGNPSGRPRNPPEPAELEALCREKSIAAVERLERRRLLCCRGGFGWPRITLASLCRRAGYPGARFGKPPQPIEHSAGKNLALQIVMVPAPKPVPAPNQLMLRSSMGTAKRWRAID